MPTLRTAALALSAFLAVPVASSGQQSEADRAAARVHLDVRQKEIDLLDARQRMLGLIQEDLNNYGRQNSTISRHDLEVSIRDKHQELQIRQREVGEEIARKEADLTAARQREIDLARERLR